MPVERKYGLSILDKPFSAVGALVTCPNCKKFIARVTTNIQYGTALKNSHFEGPTIRPGAPMKCVECNMPWFIAATGQIHLEQGWFPKPT